MCGITGLLRHRGRLPSEQEIRAMTQAVAHRGPDGEGIHLQNRIALGHRRLSIIDLESGQQPMCNEDGNVWVTYNGEIYNFRELRERLISLGHTFRTKCDTEVIVHAYEQWGPDCVKEFRGMFAFGLVDFRNRKLLLARDHLGIKPLFIRFHNDCIAFASELSALMVFDTASPSIDPSAIEHYLRYRCIPHPQTIYKEVKKLAPAHYQVFDFEGRTAGPQRYWEVDFNPQQGRSEDEWLEAFEEVLNESVKTHLVADVPFGAFLSGGIDSTLIAMKMGEIMDRPVKAFTIGFDEAKYSEISFAQEAAKELGIELRAEVVKPDIVSTLDLLAEHYGEPYADTSALPTWCCSKLAREEVPMVLSGDGGDEGFGGYQLYDLWMNYPRTSIKEDLKKLGSHPRPVLKRLFAKLTEPASVRYSRYGNYVAQPLAARETLWREEYRSLTSDLCPAYFEAERQGLKKGLLTAAQYVDLNTYLPCDILTKVDIASMCHGLEVRTPFTDVKVIEFAATLPEQMRRKVASNGDSILKLLPKKSLESRFSNKFVHRPKMGFAIPEIEWLRSGTEVRTQLDDLTSNTLSPLFDFMEPDGVLQITKEFDETGNGAIQLWQVLILGKWLDRQKDSLAVPTAA